MSGRHARPVAALPVEDVKATRESLCFAQWAVTRCYPRATSHAKRLQELIDACDVHRPLGHDGKHGNRHTLTCGCDL